MKNLVKMVMLSILVAPMAACSSENEEDLPNPPVEQGGSENKGTDSIVVDMLPKTQSIELTDEQKGYVAKSNDFSFNLYRAVSKQLGQKSSIISPLSISYVLGMLNSGAQGKTAQEITTLLGFGADDKQTVSAFHKRMIEEIPQVDSTVELNMANLLAMNSQVMVEQAYYDKMKDSYHADVAWLDFASPDALSTLNDWCYRATKGAIPQIINRLDDNSLFVLMNAIHFHATWAEKFDPSDTKDELFNNSTGSTTVPMMYRKANILYEQNDTYSSICLPYGGGDKWSMTVMLPNEGKAVGDIISGLNEQTWNEHLGRMKQHVVDIRLPRFSTQSDVELNDILSGMGAPSMFDPMQADLSLMTQNYKKGLFVSLVKQKASVEVAEEGTKLSAATFAKGDVLANPLDPANFHAVRPFVYIIREASSGAIFFIGTFHG